MCDVAREMFADVPALSQIIAINAGMFGCDAGGWTLCKIGHHDHLRGTATECRITRR